MLLLIKIVFWSWNRVISKQQDFSHLSVKSSCNWPGNACFPHTWKHAKQEKICSIVANSCQTNTQGINRNEEKVLPLKFFQRTFVASLSLVKNSTEHTHERKENCTEFSDSYCCGVVKVDDEQSLPSSSNRRKNAMMHAHARNWEATQRLERDPRISQFSARACISPTLLSPKHAILIKGTFRRNMHILPSKME